MKRCPQCEFIYPDSDNICDFDQTPLVAALESEIAAITNTEARPALADLAATHSKNFADRRTRKTLPFAAVLGLLLGVVFFVAYFAVRRQLATPPPPVIATSTTQVPQTTPTPVEAASPTPVESASPVDTQATQPKPLSSSQTTTAHTTTNTNPVSTSTDSKARSGKSVILLTSGGKVEADEVWRTKDGVWYRRDGVVTLLKKNRVKAIVNQ